MVPICMVHTLNFLIGIAGQLEMFEKALKNEQSFIIKNNYVMLNYLEETTIFYRITRLYAYDQTDTYN